ncbi:MAG: DNA gyrase subunit A [Chitinophagales bacterium]
MAIDGNIIQINIEEEMKSAYIDYSMSVIVSRALPDVRDGLKPVQRRVLFSMSDLGLGAGKPYKKSARIVGECFVAGTLVSTPKGLIPIEDLEIGAEVYTQSGTQKITQLYIMPKQPLLEVETSNGAVNVCTKGQMFKVFTPNLTMVWKEAKNIQIGDYIVSRSISKTNTEYSSINNLNIDEDLGYFLGHFLADGWIDRDNKRGYHRISFANNSIEIMEEVQRIIKVKFDENSNISSRNGMFYLRIHNTKLNSWLIETLGISNKLAHNIEVPNYILQSPKSVICAFISGFIDGDGSIHKNRNSATLFSISEKFIRQIQALFINLGIYSTIYAQECKPTKWKNRVFKRNFIGYSLEISSNSFQKLSESINLIHPKKQNRLKVEGRLLVEKYEKLPFMSKAIFQEFRDKHIGGGWYEGKDGKKIRAGVKYPNGTKIRYSKDLLDSVDIYYATLERLGILKKLEAIDSEYYSLVSDWIENGISFMEVKSVKEAHSDITYDIQVANEHEFIANGMLVHNCLGKYHPHGDSSVYDAMVRMAQPWSLRYPLVDGQGNFGSVDGDNSAAMRYTEARLKRITEDILTDIEKDTVNFRLNFDDSLEEPTVLPSKIPNLLVNGATGIAVGMATNMLPHNLTEIVDGIVAYIDNPEIDIDGLMEYVKAPDFPTGGTIYGYEGIKEGFKTGRGRIVVRGRSEIELYGKNNERERIIVTEIPYQVNKARLIEKTAELVNSKRIEGITAIRDESDRNGMRIVYEIRRDANAQVVLNQLYSYTYLQSSFGVNNVCLVNGRPRLLNLKELMKYFVEFRHEVVIRRTQYDLRQAEKRAHLLEGYLIALDHLDEIIKLIRGSQSPDIAKQGLMDNFGLSDIQAKAILDMRLQRLTAMERDKIKNDYEEVQQKIAHLNEILANEPMRMGIIKDELAEVKAKYGDVRKTDIVAAEGEMSIEDLTNNEQVVVSISHLGYMKRTSLTEYREQNRGGKGSKGSATRDEDFVEHLFIGSTHDYLLVFTEQGRCHWLRMYNVPEGSKTSKGRPIQNIVQLPKEDKARAYLTVTDLTDEDILNNHYVMFCTKYGVIKKTPLKAFSRPRQNGINAIGINEGDRLLEVKLTNGHCDVVMGIRSGRAIRFPEDTVRSMGRNATGVRGIRLKENSNDEVVGMLCIDRRFAHDTTVLVVSEKGYGKRTDLEEYRVTNRGGKGVKTINVTTKTGNLIAMKDVVDENGLMIINKSGISIRMSVADISTSGRATQGVRLINLNDDDDIASVAKIPASEEDDNVGSEDNPISSELNDISETEMENTPPEN